MLGYFHRWTIVWHHFEWRRVSQTRSDDAINKQLCYSITWTAGHENILQVLSQFIRETTFADRIFLFLVKNMVTIFNPFMPSGLFYLNSLDQPISSLRVSGQFWLLLCFTGIPVVNANNVDPDQTPRSATSDLGLQCLPMSHLRDARHKRVKRNKNPRATNPFL